MATATARMSVRVSTDAQKLISDAAAAQGTDVTSFVVAAATSQARKVLLEERALKVTPAEALQIQALLASEFEVPAGLKAAADRLASS
ncbi:type II toxin-antitoxin system TacA family antitoxin [Schumannella luteola]